MHGAAGVCFTAALSQRLCTSGPGVPMTCAVCADLVDAGGGLAVCKLTLSFYVRSIGV